MIKLGTPLSVQAAAARIATLRSQGWCVEWALDGGFMVIVGTR